MSSLANRYLSALLSCPPGPRARAGYSFWQRYWASLTGTVLRPRLVQTAAAQFPDARLRARRQPGPVTSVPHAVTNAEVADDLADFGVWVPSAPQRRSYRQPLSVALAMSIIIVAIVLIKTAIHTSVGLAPTEPLTPASASPGTDPNIASWFKESLRYPADEDSGQYQGPGHLP